MPLTDSAARTLDSSDVRTYVGKIDPEVAVEVLDDGKWRRGHAYYRQRLDDGWWYHVRVYWPPMRTAPHAKDGSSRWVTERPAR